MNPVDVERLTDSYRGLLLGLVLGESIGRGHHRDAHAVIRAGVSSQLAAFTVEGMIRASVRMSHRGISNPPDVIWNAYRRWGSGQGLAVAEVDADPESTDSRDGWLKDVSSLRERRGSSPTTVAVLTEAIQPGSPEQPVNNSMGCQGLVRVLPLAVLGVTATRELATDVAKRVTALTHGSPIGLDVTDAAVTVAIVGLLSSTPLEMLLHSLGGIGSGPHGEVVRGRVAGLVENEPRPRDLATLRSLAPDKTALSALHGALYVAAGAHEPGNWLQAVEFAAAAPDSDSVAAVAGALLGAAWGASVLPVELLSRHELAWPIDTLARDAVRELTDSPGGGEYTRPKDPHWWERYPGW